ncbi:uncharacterized protein AB675_9473 [Cyphellophora attinorum]|uniref:Lysosomal acid phosphatase n=1 Tax=Cyphellophora attinorum TaxID=1664694 RepID=A0A0N1H783_9EURO|nr:uncharacterized protein AB675_9473 [Phialophora attinorum]KPI42264.1 hypothetical protein AB675_9473 [Phialophora attinorum]
MQVVSKIAALAALAATVDAHFIQSVLVFTRHGDRTSKFYKGYEMTALGAQQVYQSGQFYRERYLTDSNTTHGHSHPIRGISRSEAVASQIWASAPDQHVLYQTATNFLQGLYPPIDEAEELNNGSSITGPLAGYQYILIHGEDASSPDTIWLKGDDECPNYDAASKSYKQSAEYAATLASSADFYAQFIPQLGSIMADANVSYAKAYDVFDLINAFSVSEDNLDQLRYYADEWEWNSNFNASQPDRSIGGKALAGGILRQLQAVVQGKGKTKFSLMAGSYDTFLSFFGLADLQSASPDFMGLPAYASSMAFELFTENSAVFDEEDLYVRFHFRNGTESDKELEAYPLFGSNTMDMPWSYFVAAMGDRAITTVADWCVACGSEAGFCVAANATADAESESSVSGQGASGSGGLSNAAAGGIGAAVALAVVGLVGAAVWLAKRRRGGRDFGVAPAGDVETKRVSLSESGSDRGV